MRVIHYYPFGYCYPVPAVADPVACNQLDYFRARGYEVDCVFSNQSQKSWAQGSISAEVWVGKFGDPTRCALGHHDHFGTSFSSTNGLARHMPSRLSFPDKLTCSSRTKPSLLPWPWRLHQAVGGSWKWLISCQSFTQQEVREARIGAKRALAKPGSDSCSAWRFELCQVFDRVIMLSPIEHRSGPAPSWGPCRAHSPVRSRPGLATGKSDHGSAMTFCSSLGAFP